MLLGGIAVPVGYRWYNSWKASEVERLQVALDDLLVKEPINQRAGNWVTPSRSGDKITLTVKMHPGSTHAAWNDRLASVSRRIEELTGSQPSARPLVQLKKQMTLTQAWRRLGVLCAGSSVYAGTFHLRESS